MKIAVVSASDSKGGAAKIASTLALGLSSRGHSVDFLVGKKDGSHAQQLPTSDVMGVGFRTRLVDKVIHRVGVINSGLQARFPRKTSSLDFSNYDIIHVHDPPGMNLRWLPWLSRQAPLVWTIHSMAPLTGNCVYPYACERWKHHCGSCPQFGTWPLDSLPRDASRLNMWLKRYAYSRSSFTAVGVSEWISARVRESVMGRQRVQTIQNAIDPSEYFPVNKTSARSSLGIREDQFAIAFSTSANVADQRKGMDIVLKAADLLSRKHNCVFMPMSIGASIDGLAERLAQKAAVLQPRHLSGVEQLREYYSAADLTWHPSRADTSSMVSMESMACGTPVVAASVGGVPEVIGDAGVLIPPESPEELVSCTEGLISNRSSLEQLSIKARQRVSDHFTLDRFLTEHETLYSSLLRAQH